MMPLQTRRYRDWPSCPSHHPQDITYPHPHGEDITQETDQMLGGPGAFWRDSAKSKPTGRTSARPRSNIRRSRIRVIDRLIDTLIDLNVLELGSNVAAAYAARLLGDQGADVVKLEPTGGDPLRRAGPFRDGQTGSPGGLFLALNLNKRSATVDLESSEGRDALARLLDWADVVVHGLSATAAAELGLDEDSITRVHPRLVVLAVTPFGQSGPYAEFAASELTLAHGGGWASICPMTHPEPEYPPLKMHGHHCSMMAAVSAATAALAVARDARRTGIGEVIDFSVQAYVGSVLEFAIHVYTYHGAVVRRTYPRSVAPWRIFETRDGAIFLMIMEQDQWGRLVEFMGNPEWTELEVVADMASRGENRDLVHTLMEEFIGKWDTFDLYHAAQQHRICFSPVMTFQDLSRSEHLRARDFFVTVEQPGVGPVEFMAPVVLTENGRATYRLPAPDAGEHTDEVLALDARSKTAPGAKRPADPQRPLAGIRVVDMTWVWAGTFGSMNLAHLGADVIRVESSVRPDLYRRGGAAPEGIEPSLNTAGMFNQWNQGKRSVAVDLRSEEGVALVKALVAQADVVTQNFATGVLERLGLGYEVLRGINPQIILASVSGYGQTGPSKHYMAYGPATGPLSGLSSVSGFPGEGPEETGLAMPDPTAGITAAYGVVAALIRRDASGVGEHIDVSLWEATAAINVDAWMEYALTGSTPERIGNRDPAMAPHGAFPTAGEDEWVSIACTNEEQWRELCQVVPGLTGDASFSDVDSRKANEAALEEVLSAWSRQYDRWYITGLLQARGIAAFPSFTVRDVIEDAHHEARGFIERLDHPEVGARAHTGIPWLMANRPNGVVRPAPCLGQHNREVLVDVLGYPEEKIADLDARGVLK